jgi:lysine-N-methylase
MSLPIRHLPIIQNWDCHTCGTCCKEYVVTITDEERGRIEAQGWDGDPVVGEMPLFKKSGPWWRRRYHLNHRDDGSCVFLSEEGRCRIHERMGYEAKPLPCRLFPFVLIPAGDHWRVGMRYACPSAAANKGRETKCHEPGLRKFAEELTQREKLDDPAKLTQLRSPRLQGRQSVDWSDIARFNFAVLGIIRNRSDRMERRLRKCLAFADLCRQSRFDQITGKRLGEFLSILVGSLDGEVPSEPSTVSPPNWVGRILFRQAAALFTRKDHGPDRGVVRYGRAALITAAWRFAMGKGPVPRMHNRMPETTFEQIESTPVHLSPAAEETLERYYTVKVESYQFFGPTNFNLGFWEGLEMLALTFPLVLWVTRAMAQDPPEEAVMRALTFIDDHFGYNRVLRTARQRVSFQLLARSGELKKLIAWYSR